MSSLIRRLTAVMILLSVLLGTPGWTHACGTRADASAAGRERAPADASAPVVHDAQASGGHDAHCWGTAGRARETVPVRHGVPVADGCASIAHCMTWTPETVVGVAAAPPTTAAPPVTRETRIPLGPDAEPAFPPPRA